MTEKDLQQFRQFVIERYGKSTYQIALELAMGEYIQGDDATHSWRRAEIFLDEMMGRYLDTNKL